ncbi:MAG: response regulator [Gammaproteobacteria bacterium]|nr:response regulator [Gammaproteobacteria bacterium]MCW8923805.1 response regulator [Gammaproteobacteria bacterium]
MGDQADQKAEILIVDDSKVIRKAATKMLGDGYVIHEAVDGRDGWQQIQQNASISVVFTDMQMPEMNGMELLDSIRSADDERIAGLPVIMITGQGDTEETKQQVFEAGATDFIAKPFSSIDLLTRAKSYAQLNAKVVELEKQTGHDKLTGLFNANSFEEQGDKALSFASRHGVSISAVYLEIDGFQDIFLSHGKSVATQIIIAVAKRFEAVLRTEDVAARIGVSKYALLLPLTSHTHAKIVVDRVRAAINKLVFDTGKEKIRIVLAAGLASPEAREGMQFSEIMDQADDTLKRALGKAGDKIASYVEAQPKQEADETGANLERELQQAFKLILEGNYFKIERSHLKPLVERLTPFMEYVENQDDIIDEFSE